MSAEALLGRSLAVIGPLPAWRVPSQRGRIGLAGAYVVVGYVAVLTTLLLARPQSVGPLVRSSTEIACCLADRRSLTADLPTVGRRPHSALQ